MPVFACPKCHSVSVVAPQQVGMEVACPECNHPFPSSLEPLSEKEIEAYANRFEVCERRKTAPDTTTPLPAVIHGGKLSHQSR